MNLFGIKFGNDNGKFIKRSECHETQKRLEASVEGIKLHFDLKLDALNNRITDLFSTRQ